MVAKAKASKITMDQCLRRLLLLAIVANCAVAVWATTSRPNVVFIVADDLGFSDVGFRNNNEIRTPNIDNFAKEGIVLEKYYVQAVCSPTRATFMTGIPITIRVIEYHHLHTAALDKTMAEKFKVLNGHAVGKWHRVSNGNIRQRFEVLIRFLASILVVKIISRISRVVRMTFDMTIDQTAALVAQK